MKSLKELIEKAKELKNKGLTTEEIANALNVQRDTAIWLVLHAEREKERITAMGDIYVDWSNLGRNVTRLKYVGKAMADFLQELIIRGEIEEPEVIAGLETGGVPLALQIAEELKKDFAIIRPRPSLESTREEKQITGIVSPSFATVKNKKTLVVSDVITTGTVIKHAVESLRELEAKPVGILVLIDKKCSDELNGVPVKYLLRLIQVTR